MIKAAVLQLNSKFGTKKFEKEVQGTLDSGIKKTGLMYNNKVNQKIRWAGLVSVKNRTAYTFHHYLLRQNPVILVIKRYAIWAVNWRGSPAAQKVLGALLDVQVVNNDAVAEQSGIFGLYEMNVTVKGTTKLHGAEISSELGLLTLKTENRELSNIKNSTHKGAVALMFLLVY